jgi:hypothetical protein
MGVSVESDSVIVLVVNCSNREYDSKHVAGDTHAGDDVHKITRRINPERCKV